MQRWGVVVGAHTTVRADAAFSRAARDFLSSSVLHAQPPTPAAGCSFHSCLRARSFQPQVSEKKRPTPDFEPIPKIHHSDLTQEDVLLLLLPLRCY
ncbi:Hypothetical predicted protein [Cloeon dipterum]|uniref:Uncharacterized protein n=1 Tax=Cloeon dipterum TaxID=197152 RepID=A0A8S1CFI2_9INSE|nr:Hypothetical predicted protein [Cloeon dipterum]